MNEVIIKRLIEEAKAARKYSYCPYSNYAVGAALLTNDDTIYRGCNIENAAYSPAMCAERTAMFKAVSEGKMDFKAIAVVGYPVGGSPDKGEYAAPCGVCRQVMAEWVGDDFPVIMANDVDDYKVSPFKEVLPMAFGPKNLRG